MQFHTPEARLLHAYWSSLIDVPGRPPRRECFEPSGIKEILPLILLLHRRCGDAFEIRLMGMRVQNRLGGNFTGSDFMNVFREDLRASRRAIFGAVLDRPAILYFTSQVGVQTGATIPAEGLFLPLEQDGEVCQIVGLTVRREPLRYDRPANDSGTVVQVRERGEYELIDLAGHSQRIDADRREPARALQPPAC